MEAKMKYIAVAKTTELSSGEKAKITLEDREILLANIEDSYYAVDNKCPHMGASLSDGKLDGRNIVCPKHGSKFDVQTGKVAQSGKMLFINVRVKDLHIYPVKIEGTDILIGIE
jgi:3-phenylpropionate/trans-cinnamate dioxygenase ferredoxin component